VGLAENATQCADWNFTFPWHNSSIDDIVCAPNKLNMASVLAGFDKVGCFQATFDFAKRLRL
jgi:hypothetical protein